MTKEIDHHSTRTAQVLELLLLVVILGGIVVFIHYLLYKLFVR